ncbi:MAG: SRPBCC family protein [Myxococcota bacterium]|nr:hypothetical protein [Deltaproteobacteria bacterium]MCP4239970.1 SRPBCC family protein [bacterium]MDP6075244.1 SRPBCC family protein [Myxococcota bacterium]MDP6243730.1 SRPBCC family protein [Myxococcota bacterium]MDP7074989.1 SRPBCC family protein [Myxococcota bacterium]
MYTTTAKLPVAAIWDFVKEMDNWAPFVTGYQAHEKQSETDSLWTLKGDVGALARVVQFRVQITDWKGPSRVAFDLKGLNEPLEGGGSFEMRACESEGVVPAGSAPGTSPILRLFEAIARCLLRFVGGSTPRRAAGAEARPGEGAAELSFRLEVNPGGPMAPMLNALMKPAMLPAAEQLADGIVARLEEIHGTKA